MWCVSPLCTTRYNTLPVYSPLREAVLLPGSQMQRKNLPILGIEWIEERENREDQERIYKAGPCTRCGELDWLSHKNGDYLCHHCWYGPDAERDPVVRDIRRFLLSTWRQLAENVEEGLENEPENTHIINGATIEEVQEVYCPHCLDTVDHVKLAPSDEWMCPTCVEKAAEAWAAFHGGEQA